MKNLENNVDYKAGKTEEIKFHVLDVVPSERTGEIFNHEEDEYGEYDWCLASFEPLTNGDEDDLDNDATPDFTRIISTRGAMERVYNKIKARYDKDGVAGLKSMKLTLGITPIALIRPAYMLDYVKGEGDTEGSWKRRLYAKGHKKAGEPMLRTQATAISVPAAMETPEKAVQDKIDSIFNQADNGGGFVGLDSTEETNTNDEELAV